MKSRMRGAIIGAVIGIASLISLYLPYYTSHITLGYFFKLLYYNIFLNIMKLFGLSLWGWFFYNNEKLLNILLSILFITLCAFLGFLIASFYKKKKKQYENHEDIKLSIGEFFKRYKYVIVLVLIVLFSFVTINFISSIKNPGLLCEKVIGSSDLKELEKLNGDSDIIIFDDDTLKELKLEELLNDPESTSRMLQIWSVSNK